MCKSFLLCLLFTVSVLFAGENGVHNVSFSYGFFNLTGGSIVAGNAIASSFGADDQQEDVNLLSLPAPPCKKTKIGFINPIKFSFGHKRYRVIVKTGTGVRICQYAAGFKFFP